MTLKHFLERCKGLWHSLGRRQMWWPRRQPKQRSARQGAFKSSALLSFEAQRAAEKSAKASALEVRPLFCLNSEPRLVGRPKRRLQSG